MGTFDTVLLVIFSGFVGAGFYFGLIHTLGAIFGVVMGVVVAGNLYNQVSAFFEFLLLKPEVAKVLAFILIFLVVSRGIGYVVYAFDKGFKIIRFIPMASSINRLGGALLGFFEGALVLGVILTITSSFQISPYINQAIDSSPLAGILMTIAVVLTPLIPEVLKIKIIQ
ncbi:CvpA family protein [Patescibacteria group bacterium]|nr:CvpA family protein [Patescibacteria group bacterium]